MYINFLDDAFENEKDLISHIYTLTNPSSEETLLRCWMVSPEKYVDLFNQFKNKNIHLITTPNAYKKAHYITGWYEHFKDVTPLTVFFNHEDEISLWLHDNQWNGYFVKDFVKSLTTKRGSIAHNKDEIFEIIEQLNYFGTEGGFAIRQLMPFIPETEKRHFCFKGNIISQDYISEEIRKLVIEFSKNIPFFSFDTIFDNDKNQYIVEIGDGQVSSCKQMNPIHLYQSLNLI